MSSPFQQKFSLKNPFGKNPKLSSVDTESDLPEAQFAGDDIESYNPEGAVATERLEENYPASVDNKKKTQAKSDSPLDMYAYVSTAPHFQRLQDNIAAAFTPEKKTSPTSEDKKNQAEEAYWKSKTFTSEENNPFRDRANQIEDDSSSNFDVDLKYNPSTDYSGSYEDSKKGNRFYIGKDRNENIFNKFGK